MPTISGPGDLTAEATSASGAIVNYTVHATDPDSPVTVSCNHPSGSIFPIGTTRVICTASDAAGNSASMSFSVKVQDTTPPVITVPDTLTVQATSAYGAYVDYTASALDAVDGSTKLTCYPPSGRFFHIGTTKVFCSTYDNALNKVGAWFEVVVSP